MLRTFLCLVCICCCVLLCSCLEKDIRPRTIVIGHSDSETNLLHISLLHFAEAVEERSHGKLKVRIFPEEHLGTNAEMFQMIEKGTLDAMMMPAGQQATICPRFKTLSLPFLFSHYNHVYSVLDGPIGQEITEGLSEHNMIQLAYWENGLRQITNNRHPILVPEDLKGLRVRTPQDQITVAIFREFGADASPYPFSQLYLALRRGLFDAQENPVANIHASRFQEVQKYLTMLNYQYQPKDMIFSLSRWQSIPLEQKEILSSAAKEFGAEHRRAVVNSEAAMLVEMEQSGMEIEYPDSALFRKASVGVYEKFYIDNPWAIDLVKRIREHDE